MRLLMSILVSMLCIFAWPSAKASEVAPSAVIINDDIEVVKSLSGKPGDPVAGRKWFSNRKLGNCLACHATSEQKEHPFHGEVGPAIDGVADRYEAKQLRAILVNAKVMFGKQTIMPGFYTTEVGVRVSKKFKGKTILSAQQVEDIIAYLGTIKE